ncbi:MAG: hypothetical protein ACFHWX_01110 [Bacteroidota bacterium]
MSKEDYSKLLPILEAIPTEEVMIPNVPVDVYIQEAYDLQAWIKDDHNKLKKAGLDPELIAELPVRSGALRHAQSTWMKEQYSQEEAEREWNEKSPAVYELKNSLEASFRFAFRRRTDLLSKVQVIEEGYGHADMVQDLSDLAVLGKANTNLLQAIGMDMKELEVAENHSSEMATLLGRVNGDKFDDSKSKVMRDRAYTHLKRLVDEIRVTGKYVFRKDKEKLRGFSSAYFRRTRN